jgi:hypothetical protein
MEEMRNTYKILFATSEGKISLGICRCSWEDNIKMNLKEGKCGCEDSVHLPQGRGRRRAFVNTIMNSVVP